MGGSGEAKRREEGEGKQEAQKEAQVSPLPCQCPTFKVVYAQVGQPQLLPSLLKTKRQRRHIEGDDRGGPNLTSRRTCPLPTT